MSARGEDAAGLAELNTSREEGTTQTGDAELRQGDGENHMVRGERGGENINMELGGSGPAEGEHTGTGRGEESHRGGRVRGEDIDIDRVVNQRLWEQYA